MRLLERVRKTGQTILITKNGVPCAVVGPPPPEVLASGKFFGRLREEVVEAGDLISPTDIDWKALK